MKIPSLFEIVLDPERAQIEQLEPSLFDIVLRPEDFIKESAEDESGLLEENPDRQQPKDPNDYDQFRYQTQWSQSGFFLVSYSHFSLQDLYFKGLFKKIV